MPFRIGDVDPRITTFNCVAGDIGEMRSRKRASSEYPAPATTASRPSPASELTAYSSDENPKLRRTPNTLHRQAWLLAAMCKKGCIQPDLGALTMASASLAISVENFFCSPCGDQAEFRRDGKHMPQAPPVGRFKLSPC
ncbi:hypothetical protein HAP47_0026585 [Bradyrhizobium sp. 41S5]|uniref:hypothetical protein n=1 Tax=Bradyrhizobium sp. 41S5 TaxID=1404443 RepID=UPI00156AC7DC|nr:hypothetical protein [Bradyrhizobium sp. 41S5]UFX42783.1 hypothetical protein HAP47_0026585 [Bradyrhizobium sp. 41S5]